MDIDAELYNKLLEKDLEWGHELGTPLIEKAQFLLKDYKETEQTEIVNYIESVRKEISNILYDEYEKAYKNSEYKKIDFKEFIKNKYSWINNKNIQHFINQAGYYAWHEGLLPKGKNEDIFDKIFGSIFWSILHIFKFIYTYRWIIIAIFIIIYVFVMIRAIMMQAS